VTIGDRSRTPEGQVLAEEAVARLVAGRGWMGLGLGWHEGSVDPGVCQFRFRRGYGGLGARAGSWRFWVT
jgi:hypothetical protein